jgi:hypothetical protein
MHQKEIRMNGDHFNNVSQIPAGWLARGDAPEAFVFGTDQNVVHSGRRSASIKSRAENVEGFGTLMQKVSAENYCGKRLQLSAFVKTQNDAEMAGLWMRIDDADGKVLDFDNMSTRLIQGNVEWTHYTVVLDVPEHSALISFGVTLAGLGQVWIDGVQLDVVSYDIPTTTMNVTITDTMLVPVEKPPLQPQNLNFEA